MGTGHVLLGIDVSTTAVKAVLVDADGRVVGAATTPLTLSTPHPLWAEQSPEDWWAATLQSVREVLTTTGRTGHAISAVGLTGQMHGLVTLNEHGAVLRPAILWNDQRTAEQCDAIRASLGRQRLIQITGNDALTGFTAPKLLWLRDHEPDVYAQVRHVLLPKDFVRLRMSGEYYMDKADGSGTLLFDLRARDWSPEVLRALDIPASWLPPTHEGTQIAGAVSREAAQLTGLAEGTPIVAGGGDQAAGAVGVGAITPGDVMLVLGTSGVVFAPTAEPLIEPDGRLHAFCHAIPDRWHLMGVMLSAAGSLQWYRDTLAPGTAFDDLLLEAEQAPPGADGLIFLPYLAGERTPHPDPVARGAFVGLTLRHTRAHLTRAVLEGVAFGLKENFQLLQQAIRQPVAEIRSAGGGARSNLWRQIVADTLGVPLVSVEAPEGAAFGAALLAGVGAGIWTDVATACDAAVRLGTRTMPDTTHADVYARNYAEYTALYPALSPSFTRMSTPHA